jgi:deoxyribodipyrimidine photo-lyase
LNELIYLLVDFDVGINWAMWRWIASIGQDPEKKFHINVVKQGYDYDNDGEYVKIWLPQLANLPKDLIQCPFRMSLVDQKRYKCTSECKSDNSKLKICLLKHF